MRKLRLSRSPKRKKNIFLLLMAILSIFFYFYYFLPANLNTDVGDVDKQGPMPNPMASKIPAPTLFRRPVWSPNATFTATMEATPSRTSSIVLSVNATPPDNRSSLPSGTPERDTSFSSGSPSLSPKRSASSKPELSETTSSTPTSTSASGALSSSSSPSSTSSTPSRIKAASETPSHVPCNENDALSSSCGRRPEKDGVTGWEVDPSIANHLWPDAEHRNAPPSFEQTGSVQKQTLPYPSDMPDNVKLEETLHNPDEYFDPNIFMSRFDMMHSPFLFHVGLESYADLRISGLTRTSTHIGLDERQHVLKHQLRCDTVLERSAPRNDGTEEEVNYKCRRNEAFLYIPSLDDALAFDHSLNAHYYTYSWAHERGVSHQSEKDTASAPAEPAPPASEVLARLIQGDAVYEPFFLQLLDQHFPFDRFMDYNFLNHFCDRFVELMHVPDRPPLVLHLHKLQVFPFTLRCLYHRPNALASASRKFVILATEIDETAAYGFFFARDVDPKEHPEASIRYLLQHPLLVHWYSTNGNIRHPKFTALPIGVQFYFRSESPIDLEPHHRKGVQEVHQAYTQLHLDHLSLAKMFPHITSHPLQFGISGCMLLERALEVLVGSTVKPPVKIIPLDQLPERITTFYVVLMPIERDKRADRPSLTDDVIIFEEPSEANHHRTASVQHIALLPYTAAVYRKYLQVPFGLTSTPMDRRASSSGSSQTEAEREAFDSVALDSPIKEFKIVMGFKVWDWRKSWFDWLNGTAIAAYPGWGQDRFYQYIHNHTFVAAPPGNGYECFRAWESLTLGAIPILLDPSVTEAQGEDRTKVFGWYHQMGEPAELHYTPEVQRMGVLEPYRDLPVVFIRNVSEMTLENMMKWRHAIYERFQQGGYKMEKLFMQYWIDRIYGHSNDEES